MKPVSIYEAKARLSELVVRASKGETVIIARNGKPVARIVPLEHAPRRGPGGWEGRVRIAPDFEETDALLVDLMLGPRDG